MSNFSPYTQPLVQIQDPSISSFTEPIERQDNPENKCADACWCWVKFVIIINIIGFIIGLIYILIIHLGN